MNVRFQKGESTLATLGTTAGTIGVAFYTLYSILSPRIDAVDAKQYQDHEKVAGMEASVAEIPSIKDSAKNTEYYIKYGILPRLQLDDETILDKARSEEQKLSASTSMTKL